MLLGVILFFDGALLALGNVCRLLSRSLRVVDSPTLHTRCLPSSYTDSFLVRLDPYHWATKDVLLLRTKAETEGDCLLHWRNLARVHQVASRWSNCRDDRVLEPVRVRPV